MKNKTFKLLTALFTVVLVVGILAVSLGVIPTSLTSNKKVTERPQEQIAVKVLEHNPKDETTKPAEGEDVEVAPDGRSIYELEAYESYGYHRYEDDEYDTYESVLNNIPEYTGKQYISINRSYSFYTDIADKEFINYSELDALGRCGVAYGMIGPSTRQKEERKKDLSVVTPSGWNQVYIKDKYGITLGENEFPCLYSRSHLIAYCLGGGEVETRDIVTGTYAFNKEMQLFEETVKDYIDVMQMPVSYRVTPVYQGDELICRGVLMEAIDVQTQGQFLNFCVFVFNVQPEFEIDYYTGKEIKL